MYKKSWTTRCTVESYSMKVSISANNIKHDKMNESLDEIVTVSIESLRTNSISTWEH